MNKTSLRWSRGQTIKKSRTQLFVKRWKPQNIKELSALLLETLQGSHWGSRGREFKSRHSDQKKALAIASAFFNEIRLRRVKFGFAK